jgi:hypothetical protein
VTIKRDINNLIPPKARGKKLLAPLSGSLSIAQSRGIGRLSNGGKLATELRELKSSDGLFVMVYQHVIGIGG